jgi:glycosyltransferase involved in cell wall biosynthesis
MTGVDDIAIVIPAFNPGGKLAPVLSKTLTHIPKRQIIVVNDGSSDGTNAVAAKSGVQLVRHEKNRGKGAALKSGFEHALAMPQIQAVITLDADGQHDPKHVFEFIRAWRETSVDLIIGCRQLRWPPMPLWRVMSNRLTSALVSRRLGIKIPDSQSGYRLHSRRLLEQIHLTTNGYEMESELLLKAVRAKMKVGFISIATIYSGEQSHIQGWRDIGRFINMWLSLKKKRTRQGETQDSIVLLF